jgi:hypothetical protein
MTLRSEGLAKGFRAGAAIAAKRIVKFDSADTTVIQGAAATDSLIGVADLAASSGGDVDVIMSGVAIVELGGTVTRGGLLTADANGKAVAAVPATGVNNRVIGIAMVSGVSGDLGSVLIAPGSLQGA